MSRACRALAALGCVGFAALAGCPRDVSIDVSPRGFQSILNSCIGEQSASVCTQRSANISEIYRTNDSGQACLLEATHVQVLLAPRDGSAQAKLSACVPLLQQGAVEVCGADEIRGKLTEAISGSLGAGLGGLDIDATEDALAAMLTFGTDECVPESMLVCARFDVVEGDSLDIVCAECNGLPSDATLACDAGSEDACFLDRCVRLATEATPP